MRIGNRFVGIIVKNGMYVSVYGNKEVGRWAHFPSPQAVRKAWGW